MTARRPTGKSFTGGDGKRGCGGWRSSFCCRFLQSQQTVAESKAAYLSAEIQKLCERQGRGGKLRSSGEESLLWSEGKICCF